MRRVSSLHVPAVGAIRGTARLVMEGRDGDLVLGIRDQTFTTTIGAQAWTPDDGADEVWVDVEGESLDVDVSVESGSGADTFTVSLPVVDVSEVASVSVVLRGRHYQARAFNASGEELVGGTYVWTLEGEVVPTGETPSDRLLGVGDDPVRRLCAELGARRACLDTYAGRLEAI